MFPGVGPVLERTGPAQTPRDPDRPDRDMSDFFVRLIVLCGVIDTPLYPGGAAQWATPSHLASSA